MSKLPNENAAHAANLLPASSWAGQVIAAGLAAMEAQAAEAQKQRARREAKRAYDRLRYLRRKRTLQAKGEQCG